MNRRSFVIAAWDGCRCTACKRAASRNATLYKNPDCTCCDEYASYLRQHGFKVDVIATPELDQIKKSKGVPQQFSGCHTTLVGGYVVEGHVPLKSIERLLRKNRRSRAYLCLACPPARPA
jgi:hypothetical protein